MGWTSYHECDGYFMEGLNRGYYKVLKSVMVGSVYYAAVQSLKRYTDQVDEEGNRIEEDIPQTERRVWAAVFLTRVSSREYYNFYYKDMSEDCGPCECQCPVSILNILSETDSEYARDWRKQCRQYHDARKSPDTMSNLPVGSIISFIDRRGQTHICIKHSPAYQFKRAFWYSSENNKYIPKKYIPREYVILSRG